MNGPEEREQKVEMKDQMTEFEQALARSMRRVEVSAETAAKFLALAEEAERKRVLHPSEQRTFAGDPGHAGGGFRLIELSNAGRVFAMPRPRSWLGGAIAAVLAMGVFVGAHIHEQHERRVEAQKQFETAERITDETLAHTRAELARQGIELEQ
ncbi:MAG TPA: hypothetical protein VFA99_04420 [Acidobacteriaceae bacterium]|nr:hypothetical protein [Acidobacteriaceae bacterium]